MLPRELDSHVDSGTIFLEIRISKDYKVYLHCLFQKLRLNPNITQERISEKGVGNVRLSRSHQLSVKTHTITKTAPEFTKGPPITKLPFP